MTSHSWAGNDPVDGGFGPVGQVCKGLSVPAQSCKHSANTGMILHAQWLHKSVNRATCRMVRRTIPHQTAKPPITVKGGGWVKTARWFCQPILMVHHAPPINKEAPEMRCNSPTLHRRPKLHKATRKTNDSCGTRTAAPGNWRHSRRNIQTSNARVTLCHLPQVCGHWLQGWPPALFNGPDRLHKCAKTHPPPA